MLLINSQYAGLIKKVFLLPLFALVFFVSHAQNTAGGKKWNYLLEPYLMFPNLQGTVGVGTLPDAKVDVDASDIFNNFKMGAILYFEASRNKWAYSSDIIYLKLGQDVTPGKFINSGEVTVKQFIWEAAALRKVLPWLEAGVGLRLNSINSELDLVTSSSAGGGMTAQNKSLSKTWVDPIIIARVKSDASKKFIYQFRGDIGGFGIGSDFAWQAQAYLGYRFSKLFQATAGYRIIAADYNKGSGEERFLYDLDTFGPVVRFGFNF